MRSRLLSLTAALALAVGGLLVTSAGQATAAEAQSCSSPPHPDRYNRGGIGFDPVTVLYDGPSTECTIAGYGHTGEGINVHCKYTGFERWYYVEDTTNGKAGWASYSNLVFNTNNTVDKCS